MPDARARLTRLIELATQNAPEKQRALAFELCDLLLEWPARYPHAMREPFEALLEKVLRRLDGTTRRMIAGRFAVRADAAIALLNEIYLDVPVEARAAILERNAELDDGVSAEADAPQRDETALLDAARALRGAEFVATFARFLEIPAAVAKRILDDESGNGLAVACKGAHLGRATFSALVVLKAADLRTDPAGRTACLAAFEGIPGAGAQQLLHYWRQTRADTPPLEPDVCAA
ncbi:MAG: DUF2336 domain-containing protein [Rhizomicrobium sp.]